MTTTTKEIIRDIKLYELGIKDKLDGYDTLMGLSDLKAFKSEGDETYYGENIDDIKFEYCNKEHEYIFIKKELWVSIEDSFNLSYDEVKELTMWSIGGDPNLKGVPTTGFKI